MPKRAKPSFFYVIVVASCTLVLAMGCGSSSGGGTKGGCYKLTGPAGSKVCSYLFNSSSVKTCPSHYTMGSCPSVDPGGNALIGCCVTTLTGSGSATDITAGCYYDSTSADSVMMACGKDWSTTAP